jgi:hypothetical protein
MATWWLLHTLCQKVACLPAPPPPPPAQPWLITSHVTCKSLNCSVMRLYCSVSLAFSSPARDSCAGGSRHGCQHTNP